MPKSATRAGEIGSQPAPYSTTDTAERLSITTLRSLLDATPLRELIARARELYPGPLVYAAIQGPEFETIRFWDARAGKAGASISAFETYVNSLAYSPDGKHLACASGAPTRAENRRTGSGARATPAA